MNNSDLMAQLLEIPILESYDRAQEAVHVILMEHVF